MQDVKAVNFNERLEGDDSKNWRNLKTPETTSVDSEYETFLQSPIQFNMVNGQITDIQVSGNEPEWSVNIKKALVSLMKIRTPNNVEDLNTNNVRSQTRDLPSIWNVVEEGIDGKCENNYQFTEIPEYMVSEIYPDMERGKCEGKKVFQIAKVRDVNSCVIRSSYQINQPGKYQCATGNCKSMWQRTSMVKYVGCGASAEDMEVQLILTEGELQQDLLGINTESVVTGTRQILKLVSSRSTSSVPQINSPRTLEDLLYEYPRNINMNQPSSSRRDNHSYRKQQDQLQNLEKNPKSQRFEPSLTEDVLAKLSPDTLKEKIVKELSQIVKDLHEVEEFEKKQISNRVLSISRVVSLLSTSTMKSLYQEVKSLGASEEEKETLRQLVLEITVLSGTNPSIMFMKDLIESEEVSPLRAGIAIATIPHYIVTPTIEILDQLFELVQSPVVNKYAVLKTNSQLAFATLLNRACIDPYRVTRFPVFVYGEFCNSQTSELTSKYIPYLVGQLKSDKESERLATIFALGTIGHESIIPILMPYIEGKTETSNAFIQRMTIYSLSTVTKDHRDILLPVYSALVHNPSEDRNVRIAALSMMLKMEPSTVHFQKLATSTWFEKDNEFHKFVFSTIKSLSDIKINELPSYKKGLYNMVNKARSVFHLAKPTPVVIASTLNYFTAEWLKELQVGYEFQGAYTSVKHMRGAYAKLEYYLEELKFSPIEVAFNVEGTGKLYEKFIEAMTGSKYNPLNNVHPEWREAISSLEIKTQKDVPFLANFWVKMFDDIQFVKGVQDEHIEPLISKLSTSNICGKTPVNFVKVNNAAPTNILIPSDMGLPIVIEIHMPSVLAVKGTVNVNCHQGMPSLSFDLTKKFSFSYYGFAGTVSPFTKELIAAGQTKNWDVNYPTRAIVEMEMGKLKMTFKPNEEGHKASNNIDLWAHSVRPFATIKPMVFLDATSIVAHPNTKTIKSGSEKKSYNRQFGESLGLDLKIEMETESDIYDNQSVLDQMKLYKNNPLNMAIFTWTNGPLKFNGKPSSRYHSVRMVYNPRKSTTNEMEINLSGSIAMQKKGQAPEALNINNSANSGSSLIQTQQLEVNDQKHQKIQKLMQQLDIEQGVGFSTSVNVVLKGAEQKTLDYSLTAGKGMRGYESKWNLHLESHDQWNVCVEGRLNTPKMALRDIQQLKKDDIEYFYKNTIGFGRTCDESKIAVTGRAGVSEDQRQEAEQALPSQLCQEAVRKVEAIRGEKENVQKESNAFKKLEQELIKYSQQKQDSCRQAIRDYSTLDKVKFNIRFSNIPHNVQRYSSLLESALKGYLIPYISKYEDQRNTKNEIDIDLKFHNKLQTMDMVVHLEEETVKYQNIRLPQTVRNILPFVASKRLTSEALSRVIGGPVHPQCRVGDALIKTFDNSTYSYELDDCFHVLASDCSRQVSHAIMAKEIDGKKHIKMFTQKSKLSVAPKSSWAESRRSYDIEVDGRSIQLEKNERKEIESQQTTWKLER